MTPRKAVLALTAALLGVGALTAAGHSLAASSTARPSAPAAVVVQRGREFLARAVELRRGEVVRFTNEDEFLHHVHSSSPIFRFDGDTQDPGQAVDVAFPVAGDFTVMCGIHPKMRMSVRVMP